MHSTIVNVVRGRWYGNFIHKNLSYESYVKHENFQIYDIWLYVWKIQGFSIVCASLGFHLTFGT